MKFKIQRYSDRKLYFLNLTGTTSYGTAIAENLNLSFDDYNEILLSCNAIRDNLFINFHVEEYGFKNKEDAECAIEILEPYLIMALINS